MSDRQIHLHCGLVVAFLSHQPPGCQGDRDVWPDIAMVHWYHAVPKEEDGIEPDLGCSMFSKYLQHDVKSGNMCFVHIVALQSSSDASQIMRTRPSCHSWQVCRLR